MGYRRKSKYNAKPVIIDNIRFASGKEGKRYTQLKILVQLGEILELELQPKFPMKIDGKHVCNYFPDFKYKERVSGDVVVEEVKGRKTETYNLKLKLMKALYPQYFKEGSGFRFIEIPANEV